MMIMAIDHASAFIARQHAAEFWAGAMSAYTNWFPFLTRAVTHLCAPGFFFLMGAGVYWYAASTGNAVGRTVKRGFVLFVLAQLVEVPIMLLQGILPPAKVNLNVVTAPPPNDGTALYWGFITLSGLGLVLMVCGMLLKLRPWMWLAVSALCVVATNSLLPASGKPGAWWMALLLAPGLAQHIIAVYPVIPWLAGAAAGMYFAYWWRGDPDNARKWVWVIGLVLIGFGLALRAAGGWGNIRLPRDGSWIEFFNNVKYPPSLVFWCLSLGTDLLLLGLLVRLPEWVKSKRSPLIVFGQTPLFFYIAHFWLFTGLAFLLFREPTTLGNMYWVWGAGLVGLYPVCAWYRDFKLSKERESWWRMF